MTIHQCDICKKTIKGTPVTVGLDGFFKMRSFCTKCAKPVIDFLIKNGFEEKTR